MNEEDTSNNYDDDQSDNDRINQMLGVTSSSDSGVFLGLVNNIGNFLGTMLIDNGPTSLRNLVPSAADKGESDDEEEDSDIIDALIYGNVDNTSYYIHMTSGMPPQRLAKIGKEVFFIDLKLKNVGQKNEDSSRSDPIYPLSVFYKKIMKRNTSVKNNRVSITEFRISGIESHNVKSCKFVVEHIEEKKNKKRNRKMVYMSFVDGKCNGNSSSDVFKSNIDVKYHKILLSIKKETLEKFGKDQTSLEDQTMIMPDVEDIDENTKYSVGELDRTKTFPYHGNVVLDVNCGISHWLREKRFTPWYNHNYPEIYMQNLYKRWEMSQTLIKRILIHRSTHKCLYETIKKEIKEIVIMNSDTTNTSEYFKIGFTDDDEDEDEVLINNELKNGFIRIVVEVKYVYVEENTE